MRFVPAAHVVVRLLKTGQIGDKMLRSIKHVWKIQTCEWSWKQFFTYFKPNFSHPGDIGQSYATHLCFGIVEGLRSIIVGIFLTLHAFVPWWFDHGYAHHVKHARHRINAVSGGFYDAKEEEKK